MKTIIMAGALSLLLGNNTRAQEEQNISNSKITQTNFNNTGGIHSRTINHVKYEVIDTVGFYLYRSQQPVWHVKGYPRYTTAYFFSTDSANIQPLTIENLKKAYPSVPAFHYALDAHFRSDEELIAWDRFQQVYKIKYLLKNSLSNKN